MKTKNPGKIDAIIFDLTGTLVDQSASYLKSIELTVNNYLRKTSVTQEQIQIIKNIVGYNNEWDTAYALVTLIENRIPANSWIESARLLLPINRESKLFKDLYTIFQTCYLGSRLFERLENGLSPFKYEPGLITMEKSLVDKKYIIDLRKKGYAIGIVTGCPYQEAVISLNNQKLIGEGLFEKKYIFGKEATLKQKPNPEPLLNAKKLMNTSNPIYIGDNISDVEMCRRANIPCVYLGSAKANYATNEYINTILLMFLSC